MKHLLPAGLCNEGEEWRQVARRLRQPQRCAYQHWPWGHTHLGSSPIFPLTRRNKTDYALSSSSLAQSWHMAGALLMLTVPRSLATSRLGRGWGCRNPATAVRAVTVSEGCPREERESGRPRRRPPPGVVKAEGQGLTAASLPEPRALTAEPQERHGEAALGQ